MAQVTVIGDAAVFYVDVGPQLVGEPEAVVLAHLVEVVEHVGKRLVVVGCAHLEGELGHPLDRLGGDPRDGDDG